MLKRTNISSGFFHPECLLSSPFFLFSCFRTIFSPKMILSKFCKMERYGRVLALRLCRAGRRRAAQRPRRRPDRFYYTRNPVHLEKDRTGHAFTLTSSNKITGENKMSFVIFLMPRRPFPDCYPGPEFDLSLLALLWVW